MDEFWTQDKLFLMVGLFQFGLLLILFTIINVSQRILGKPNMSNDKSQNEIPSAAIAASRLNAIINHQETHQNIIGEVSESGDLILDDLPEINANSQMETSNPNVIDTINNVANMATTSESEPESNSDKELYKVVISPELFTELLEISNNPAATVDEAIRWWLRRHTLNALESSIDHRGDRDRLSSRSYSTKRASQELWND